MLNLQIRKNPNAGAYEAISKAINENEGFCCCKLEYTSENYCPCADFRNQRESEFCHCGRYYKVAKFPTITLCGSTKFKEEFLAAAAEWTMKGYIVLSVGVFGHADNIPWTETEKQLLDEIHRSKIEMSDAIYVINKNGYIGESTQREIEWATELGKQIYYLEEIAHDE